VNECFLESLLDNIFSVFANPSVPECNRKNSCPMPFHKRFKCLLISHLGSCHKCLVDGLIIKRNAASKCLLHGSYLVRRKGGVHHAILSSSATR
jgi:hypothetical protein